MNAIRRLSRIAMLPAAPVLLAQGRRLRRDTPRLPDAAHPWQGTLDGPEPLRLLVLGDSTAAGVGAATQDEALPGNLARGLRAHTGRGVHWQAVGRNGATARDLVTDYLDTAVTGRWDVVFLTIGANDALGLRTRAAFARDIRSILTALTAVSPVVLVSSLPAFFRFELLPNPLRFNLYLHSQSLEDAARGVAATFDTVHMSPPPPPYTEGFFATDLFHPSAIG
ncbi:SGNH/GDSL hydrolase family protein, partial [Salinibacterium sp.]|uniref:SGNH/GDSL hydrolase family protein n=1 Tax=Salinibacterium sp. TaxID=1915057 RepID=UPI00286D0C3D